MTMTAATVSPDKSASARLIVLRADAARHLQSAISRGMEIKGVRIRNGDELDKARSAKLAWIQEVSDLLARMFDNGSVADYCNDWVGKIFPEYAEFGNFVEQFYDEMDYRLGKLRTVHKRMEQAAESPAPNPPAPSLTSSAAARSSEAVMGTIAAVASPAIKVLFLSHGPRDAAADAVLQFMQQLSLPVFEADHTNGLIETLEGRNDAGFVVVMNADLAGESDQTALSDSTVFKLGYCAGRVGTKRMCLMHSAPQPPARNGQGLTQVSVDTGGGWQLHLARQMKRAGMDIDLNRLC